MCGCVRSDQTIYCCGETRSTSHYFAYVCMCMGAYERMCAWIWPTQRVQWDKSSCWFIHHPGILSFLNFFNFLTWIWFFSPFPLWYFMNRRPKLQKPEFILCWLTPWKLPINETRPKNRNRPNDHMKKNDRASTLDQFSFVLIESINGMKHFEQQISRFGA